MGDLAGGDQPIQHLAYAVGTAGERRFVVGGDTGVEDRAHGGFMNGIGYGHHDGIDLGTVQQRLETAVDLDIGSQFLADTILRGLAERRGGHDPDPFVLTEGGHERQPGPAAVTDQADSYAGHDAPFHWLHIISLPAGFEVYYDNENRRVSVCKYNVIRTIPDSSRLTRGRRYGTESGRSRSLFVETAARSRRS